MSGEVSDRKRAEPHNSRPSKGPSTQIVCGQSFNARAGAHPIPKATKCGFA
jgi:hypothetical protein